MKLSEIKHLLPSLNDVAFQLEDGTRVPEHFHVTEVGVIHKHFIDCGGTVRNEKTVNFQLWNANDYDHRLKPGKLLRIIELSEEKLGIDDWEIEVEYQTNTIGKYALTFDNGVFTLRNQQTACLASDNCGSGSSKQKISLSELSTEAASCCTPGGGCC